MNATTASSIRANQKTLSLRDKIFELHEAVRTLQTKQVRQAQPKNKDLADEVRYNSAKIEAVENQNGVLKHALGTFADAVSDEIEELQRSLTEELDHKIAHLETKIEGLSLSKSKSDNDNAKIVFDIQRMKEELHIRTNMTH